MHGNRKYRVRNSSNATRNCRNQNKAECSIKAARRISLIIHTLLASLLFHRKITAVPFTPVRGYGKQTNMASTNQMIHSSRGTPVVEDGTLQRIVGTAMDVTDHELLTRERVSDCEWFGSGARAEPRGHQKRRPASLGINVCGTQASFH